MAALPLWKDASPRSSIYLLDFTTAGLSDEESTIERERIYTKRARALDAALLSRGPAGSPGFWDNVKALLDISNTSFIPRFVANRVADIQYTVWPVRPVY